MMEGFTCSGPFLPLFPPVPVLRPLTPSLLAKASTGMASPFDVAAKAHALLMLTVADDRVAVVATAAPAW